MEENKDEVKDFIEFWRHKLEEYFVPGNDYFKDIIWIKRMDTPDPVKQEEYNVFFVKTLEELDIKSEELLFAKIVAVLSNNWNEK